MKILLYISVILLLSVSVSADIIGVDDTSTPDTTGHQGTLEDIKAGLNVGAPSSNGTIDSLTFLLYQSFGTRNCRCFVVQESDSSVVDSSAEFVLNTTSGNTKWYSQPAIIGVSITTGESYVIVAWCDGGVGATSYFNDPSTDNGDIWRETGVDYGTGGIGSSWTPDDIFTDRTAWGYITYTPSGGTDVGQIIMMKIGSL